ncbi:rCG39144 [Rattus norvegicus]|uniref:RCG39144 n=1 Tax=Rattus norvegicus TaxID=10116 RepID=A6JY65_RAT|nr:rCG39144 [Rattus norvegicus]
MAGFFFFYSYSTSAQPLPNLPNTHHWRFLARETYNGHIKITGTQDCPLEGCWTRIEIPQHTNSIPSPFLFFPYHDTMTQVTISRRPLYRERLQISEMPN